MQEANANSLKYSACTSSDRTGPLDFGSRYVMLLRQCLHMLISSTYPLIMNEGKSYGGSCLHQLKQTIMKYL